MPSSIYMYDCFSFLKCVIVMKKILFQFGFCLITLDSHKLLSLKKMTLTSSPHIYNKMEGFPNVNMFELVYRLMNLFKIHVYNFHC